MSNPNLQNPNTQSTTNSNLNKENPQNSTNFDTNEGVNSTNSNNGDINIASTNPTTNQPTII